MITYCKREDRVVDNPCTARVVRGARKLRERELVHDAQGKRQLKN